MGLTGLAGAGRSGSGLQARPKPKGYVFFFFPNLFLLRKFQKNLEIV
jgi:hypothetical protein